MQGKGPKTTQPTRGNFDSYYGGLFWFGVPAKWLRG